MIQKRRVLATVSGFTLLFVVWYCFFHNRVSRDNYDRIQHGTTFVQVQWILGGDYRTIPFSTIVTPHVDVYYWENAEAKESIAVHFTSGKVIGKWWSGNGEQLRE